MKNGRLFFIVLVILTGIAMVAADFFILLFFGHTFSHIVIRFGLPAIAFVGVYSFILGRSGKCFDSNYLQTGHVDEYAEHIKRIGSVPIKMIGLNVVLHAVFLCCIFFNTGYLGFDPVIKGPLFLAALAFGRSWKTFPPTRKT